MLNISHQRNANQNYNEVSSHTSQNGYHQKIHKEEILERVWEEGNLSYTVGGNVKWYSHYGEQYGGSLKTEHRGTM